jgi:WD40 repeat protein
MLMTFVTLLLNASPSFAADADMTERNAAGCSQPVPTAGRAPAQAPGAQAETPQGKRAAKGDPKPTVLKNDRPVGPLAWRPGGRAIAAATVRFDQAEGFVSGLKLWDTETGQVRVALPQESRTRYPSIAFSPDGKTLAIAIQTSAGVGSVKLIEPATGVTQKTIPLRGSVTSVVFSPDAGTLAIGGQDNPKKYLGPFWRTVQLWDVAKQRRGKEFREELNIDDIVKSGTLDGLRDLVFSPDGSLLAAADVDFRVRLIAAGTGHVRQTLEGHTEVILGLAFSADGKMLVSGGFDRTVRVWDVQTGKPLRTLEGNQGQVCKVALSPDGKLLATGGTIAEAGQRSSESILWDTLSWQPTRIPPGDVADFGSLAFSPDSKVLAVGGRTREGGGTIHLWQTDDLLRQRGRVGAKGGR